MDFRLTSEHEKIREVSRRLAADADSETQGNGLWQLVL